VDLATIRFSFLKRCLWFGEHPIIADNGGATELRRFDAALANSSLERLEGGQSRKRTSGIGFGFDRRAAAKDSDRLRAARPNSALQTLGSLQQMPVSAETKTVRLLDYTGHRPEKRSDQASGFVVLPRRWVVECTES
jgi:hypothetical protein